MRRSFLSALFLSTSVYAQLPHNDADFKCFDAATAQKYIKDFKINIKSFGGLELCKDSDAKKILSDIYLIEQGAFDKSLQKNTFIRDFVKADNYYNWMKGETRGMDRGDDIPYASAYNSFGYFTFQDGWAQSSTLGRVGTVIHEARHTAGHRHVICKQGPYISTTVSGCDNNVEEGGSHGVEMEYYSRVVLQGKNFHPVYQSMARLMALGRSNIFFNKAAMAKKEALMLVSESNKRADLYFQNQHSERPLPIHQNIKAVKRTSFGAVFLDNTLFPHSFDPYSSVLDTISIFDAYSYMKLLQRDDVTKLQLKDVEEYDIGLKRYFVGLSLSNEIFVYQFSKGEWAKALDFKLANAELMTSTPDGSEGLYILDRDQAELKTFDAEKGQISSQAMAWDRNIQNFVKHDSNVYALNQQGDWLRLEKNNTWTNLDNETYSHLLKIPLYDAFQIDIMNE